MGLFRYNAATCEYGDMVELGILDPIKVTRTALQIDLAAVHADLVAIEAEITAAKQRHNGFLAELGLPLLP